MFVLQAEKPATGTKDVAQVSEEVKAVIAQENFIAFSHVNFNREETNHVTTLWLTEADADAWGNSNNEAFTVVALEDSEFTREDFLSDAAMTQIKTGILAN